MAYVTVPIGTGTITNANISSDAQITTNKLSASWCRARMLAAQSIADSTETAIAFDAADDVDTDAYHDPSGAPTLFTAPSTGFYLIEADIQWAANALGTRAIKIDSSGDAHEYDYQEENAPATGGLKQSVVVLLRLALGQTARLMVSQTSGGALNCGGNTIANAQLTIARLARTA